MLSHTCRAVKGRGGHTELPAAASVLQEKYTGVPWPSRQGDWGLFEHMDTERACTREIWPNPLICRKTKVSTNSAALSPAIWLLYSWLCGLQEDAIPRLDEVRLPAYSDSCVDR